MSHDRMPPIPPANRSPKGLGHAGVVRTSDKEEATRERPENTAEQGETANIRQNTTNAGYFHGRRVK